MAFSFSTREARTALASAALLMLGTVAAPAANAYNPDIDGDGIPNTWEMKGYDADGDGKKTVLTAPNDLATLKLQAEGTEAQGGVYRFEKHLSAEIDHNEMTADLARSKGMVPAKD